MHGIDKSEQDTVNIYIMKFSLDWKVEFKKSFKIWLLNFGKSHNESCKNLSIVACHGQKWAKCQEYLQNDINPRLKVWIQKIFQNLQLNFGKSHNKSCQTFCQFLHVMDKSEQNARNIYNMKLILDWKSELKKSFKIWLLNFCKSHNESCQTFCPFWQGMDKSEQNAVNIYNMKLSLDWKVEFKKSFKIYC